MQILSWSGCSCCPPPLPLLPEHPPSTPTSTEITSVAFTASSSGHASVLILRTQHSTDPETGLHPEKPSRS